MTWEAEEKRYIVLDKDSETIGDGVMSKERATEAILDYVADTEDTDIHVYEVKEVPVDIYMPEPIYPENEVTIHDS